MWLVLCAYTQSIEDKISNSFFNGYAIKCKLQYKYNIMIAQIALIFLFIHTTLSIFCSVQCAPNQCTGISRTQCSACVSPFVPSSGTCVLDSALQYAVAATYSNGSLTSSSSGTTCGPYSFDGWRQGSQNFVLTTSGPITTFHFKLRLLVWVILLDQWDPALDYIDTTLNTSGVSMRVPVSSRVGNQPVCPLNAKNQSCMRLDLEYTHTDTLSPVSFNILPYQSGGTLKYGIKQYILLSLNCHAKCLTCTGLSNTVCQSCNTGYKLSGTTCQSTCLSGYGQTTNSTLCVLCSLKCIVCYQTSTNCSSCTTTSGANQAFLYINQCLTNCPAGYINNVTNHVCQPCTNVNCISCSSTNKSLCYSCNTSNSYWYNFDCYNPCPSATFANSPNCTDCDISCANCTNTPSPCSLCKTGYKLSGTVCNTSCLTQYGSTSNPLVCVLCDVKCVTCQLTSINCSSCTPTAPNEAFLMGNQCRTNCPTGYAGLTTTHVCAQCLDSFCVSCNPLNLTQCYQCVSPYYWYRYDCLASCPGATFVSSSTNCTDCDVSCANCTNTPSPCSLCNTGYKLSGTVCSTSCLTQYGQTTNPLVCVLCDVKCVTCQLTSINCSSCTPTAPNEAFLMGTQCVTNCPTGYAGLTTTHVCAQCLDSFCVSCNPLNLTQCYQCVSPYYWYRYDCLASCPGATFVSSSTNCTDCDVSCANCTNTPSPCSLCNTGYKLSGTVCSTSCLAQYGQTSNPLVCVLCDVKCVTCYYISTNCSSCTPIAPNEAFLLGTQCLTTCPTNYTAVIATHTCQKCSNHQCTSCNPLLFTQCYQCDSSTYWYDFDCYFTCPSGTYANSPNCTDCDPSCQECTGSPTPCSVCSSGYYFLATTKACLLNCPSGYFKQNTLMKCLNCATDCVKANIQMSLPTQKRLQILIQFDHPIDFTTFPYQTFQTISISDPSILLQNFTITYQISSDRSYKIILVPIPDPFYMNSVLFTVEINDYTTTFISSDGYQFSPTIYQLADNIIWNFVQKNQQWVLKDLQDINNQLNNFFTQPWVQQIKKTGLFALLLPGAQLCSTIILHNATPPTNMYQGARFWGSFIYFQVPQWQKNGNGQKRLFSQLVQPIIKNHSRLLQTMTPQQSIDWRFSRTGHNGYFIFDAYVPMILVILCWLPIIILHILQKRFQKVKRLKPIFYSILHRLHQISMFYIVLSICLEWTYFSNHFNDLNKYLSFSFSILFTIYCLIYQIYAFYKIIPYTYVEIGSRRFQYYVERYSFFLRDIRFEQYGLYPRWQCNHFLRPYNYQILSFFRLVLILASLPLFQNIAYGCVSCLIVFQTLQIVRFLLTWPFYTPWRNYYKLFLQVILLSTFIIYLLADVQYRTNLVINPNIIYEKSFQNIGWAGFGTLFIYNIMYFIYFLIDVVVGCMYTNRQRMQFARNLFYKQLLQNYQTFHDIQNPTLKQSQAQQYIKSSIASSKKGYISIINSIHKAQLALDQKAIKNKKETIQIIAHRGNLCQHDYQKFWKIKVKIQEYEFTEAGESKYNINYQKVKDLYMHLQPDLSRKYNILMPQKKIKQVKITPIQNYFYFKVVDNIFKHYRTVNTQAVIIRTFLKIDQNLYNPGEKISFKLQNMIQQIEVKNLNGTTQRQKLKKVLRGFPVPQELLNLL